MGIVVTVFMFLGLLFSSPWPLLGTLQSNRVAAGLVGWGLLLAGLWNFLWYGLQHLDAFWGAAALVSGLIMIIVALIILVEHAQARWFIGLASVGVYQDIKSCSLSLLGALLLCFLLYATTLIRLNLGYPVLQ